MLRLNRLCWLLVGLAADGVHSQAAPVALGQVVISATRTEHLREDLPVSMDVVTSTDVLERQIGDIKDLVQDLPNVSVRHAPARFGVTGASNPVGRDGNAGFTIRGLGGNRVLMLVDGVRLPKSYINGSNAFGRDAVPLELLKRIELVRGPSSVLYGSDGLAGLVNFISYEPADFLASHNLGGRLGASWGSDDNGANVAASVAARASETAQWLFTGSAYNAGPLDTMGNNDAPNQNRTRPNPQTNQGASFLGKLVLRPTLTHKHVLTLEQVGKRTDTELLSSRAVVLPVPTTAANRALVAGEDSAQTQRRSRLSWDARYTLETAWADRVQTLLALQNAEAHDDGRTLRNDGGVRLRDTRYSEHAWQASVQAGKTWALSEQWSQKLTYGLDVSSTEVSSWFDGLDPYPLSPYVPKKYFPDARDSSMAVYVQSEIGDERWSITPGLRLERYGVDVISQDGYAPPATLPGVSQSGVHTAPKLGALYRLTPQWSVYGNYASGFRAPNAAQLNGFIDPTPGINARLLPNPDLKPETSQHVELGFRMQRERLSLELAVFNADFDQLIVDKKFLGGANTAADPNVFQTVNIDSAAIWGLELKGRIDWGAVAAGKLSMPFAFGWARGLDQQTGLPLNSIDPALLTLALQYDTAAGFVRLDVRHHAAKHASDVDATAGVRVGNTQFSALPEATTLDLSGQWRVRKGVRVNVGLFNLTDRKYWLWSDVQGLTTATATTQLDAYSQPGRHLKAALVVDF